VEAGVNLINYGEGATPDSLARWGRLVEVLGHHLLMFSDHVTTPETSRPSIPHRSTTRSLPWRGWRDRRRGSSRVRRWPSSTGRGAGWMIRRTGFRSAPRMKTVPPSRGRWKVPGTPKGSHRSRAAPVLCFIWKGVRRGGSRYHVVTYPPGCARERWHPRLKRFGPGAYRPPVRHARASI
jgi:hypothetical protein